MPAMLTKARLMPATGRKGPRTVYRGYFRDHESAPWQTVVNGDGLPVAYMTKAAALTGADYCRVRPFTKVYGGREFEIFGEPAGVYSPQIGLGGTGTLSPAEADEFARLIYQALNAYGPAVEWALARLAKRGQS